MRTKMALSRSVFPAKPYGADSGLFSLPVRGIDVSDRDAQITRRFVVPGEASYQAQWPDPIPCPVRAWSTLFGHIGQWHASGLDAAHLSFAWNQIPAGTKVIPITNRNTVTLTPLTSASRSYTFRVYGESMVGVFISGNADVRSITFTIGGASGYTVIRTDPTPTKSPSTEYFLVPEPYDDGSGRTITITWTGGASTCIVTGFSVHYAPVPTSVPSGWDAVEAVANVQVGQPVQSQKVASHKSIRNFWGDSAEALQDFSTGRLSTSNVAATGQLGGINIRGVTLGVDDIYFYYASASRYQGYIGLPGVTSSGPTRSQVCPRSQVSTTTDDAPTFLTSYVRAVQSIHAYVYRTDTPTINWVLRDVVVNPDGSLSLVDLTSGSYSHGGTGWESFAITLPASPWDPTPGFRHPISIFADVQCSVVVIEDPCPLPVNLVSSDGVGCPGATHPDSTFPAQGAKAVDIEYPDPLTFADLPSGLGAWYGRFTGVPDGVYALYIADSSGVPTYTYWNPIWGCDEVAPQDSMGNANLVISYRGEVFFVVDNANGRDPVWGNFNKSQNTGLYAIKADQFRLAPITVDHKALSVGSNDLGVGQTQANWGLSGVNSTVFAGCYAPIFAKFTAPADGTYAFTMTRTTLFNDRPAMWFSTTDTLCLHDDPDAVDPMPVPVFLVITHGFATAPPAPSASAALYKYAISPGATGAWAGKDGYLATGVEHGCGGAVEWRFTDPPTNAILRDQSTGAWYSKQGTEWLALADSPLTASVALTSGQTLYLRFGLINQAFTCDPRGKFYQVTSGTTPKVTLTITAL